MARKAQYRRLLLLALLLAVAFAGLGYRLVDLQVLRHEPLQAEAWTHTRETFKMEPRRGDIFDARGNLLATSVFVKTVCADPSLLGDRWPDVARRLAPLLQMDEADLAFRLQPRTHKSEKGRSVTNQYVVLKHKVSAETWQRVHDSMTNFPARVADAKLDKKEKVFYRDLRTAAIFADPVDDQLRTYPNETLAAHVLGYMGLAERTNNGAVYSEPAGADGIERALNAKLSGVRGWRVTERDGHHRERAELRMEDVPARDGMNAVLTIDSVLQGILESALADAMEREKPISVSGLIVRPKTGEILAMANAPTFNPNNLEGSSELARHNLLITDSHEPGSTYKIVVVSGALNENVVQPTDQWDCENGKFFFAGRWLHDSAPHGILTTDGVIMKSSNIGAAKIGIKMEEPRLRQYMRNYGFGKSTQCGLPGEVGGIMPGINPATGNWTSKVSIAQIPMGQGVAVTSLQMTMAMCVIANKGVLMHPMIVDRLVDREGHVVARCAPEAVRRVISEDTAKKMIEALKTVVTPEGTARNAALTNYTVAGKTGTAQKPPYKSNKWYASFVGFLPADDASICIYISMDEPRDPKNLHQGGQVCAPVFRQVAEKAAAYLNLHPDKLADPSVPAPVAVREPTVLRTMARVP